MMLLATAAQWLIGSGLKWVTIPLLVMGLLHEGGQIITARRDALIKQGEQACMTKVAMAQLKADKSHAEQTAKAKAYEANASYAALTEVSNNASKLELELREAREKLQAVPQSTPARDDSCISPSVRELATTRGGKR